MPTKPRVTFIIDRFFDELAGTERQLGRMIRGLGPEFDIELICFRESEWLSKIGPTLPCRIHLFLINNFKRAYSYRNMLRLIAHLRATRPQVVHTFFPVGNIVGVICARLAGIRNVVGSRRDYGEWMTGHYLAATKFANHFLRGIVTNSHQVKRLTEDVEGFPGKRIEVIYNGIDVHGFERGAPNLVLKESLGIPRENKVVGLVANYRPMKRQETLIRAASEIVQHRDDIDFVLVGRNAVPGELREKAERLAASLGLERRVHFTHADRNIKDFLSILDVGVNCSEGEGLSNAIMEYMISGLACVVSDSGGNPDLIIDNETGLTFPLDDAHALAMQIERIVDDHETRARLTRAAAERVRNEMSLETMVGRFGDYYRRLVSQGA